MANAPLIVFEGVDGVGKTEAAKRTAEVFGFRYIYLPPAVIADSREKIEKLGDPTARFAYYLLGNLAIQPMLRECERKREGVVLDHYVHSTFAFHRVLEADIAWISAKRLPIRWPDVIILLTATGEARRARCIARWAEISLKSYDWMERDQDLLDAVQEEFVHMLPSTVINTTSLGREQVFEEVCAVLARRGIRPSV